MSFKFFVWITEKEQSIITEKVTEDGSSDDIIGYILDAFKKIIVTTKRGEEALLKKYNLTKQEVENVKLEWDDKYQRENANKKVINLYGTKFLDGFIWCAKMQQLTNKSDGLMKFTSLNDYCSVLLKEHVEALIVLMFDKEMSDDIKKTNELREDSVE